MEGDTWYSQWHRRQFRVVRATALRKQRRSKVDQFGRGLRFLHNKSEPISKESMAELEQLQAVTLQVHHFTSVMVDMDKQHMQEIQQRDVQLVEMMGIVTALNTRGSRLGPGWSELSDPMILHKVQHIDGQRTSWKTFEFHWKACFIAQDRKYREFLDQIDDPTKNVRNGDLDFENQELSLQLYFALVLVMPRKSVEELIVRNVKQEEVSVASRQILGEYASTEPGNVLAMWYKLGDLRFPQGSDIVVGINKMEKGHDQVSEDGCGKSVRHHQERHLHESVDKRSRAAEARVSQQYTLQHAREDAGRGDVGRTAHEMHHVPYRLWCPDCVEARGADDSHHRQRSLDESATPKVMFDIFIVGLDELAKRNKIVNGCFSLRDKERFLSIQAKELDQTIAVLDLIDCKTNAQGSLFANKELDGCKVNYIVAMLDHWCYTIVIFQAD